MRVRIYVALESGPVDDITRSIETNNNGAPVKEVSKYWVKKR